MSFEEKHRRVDVDKRIKNTPTNMENKKYKHKTNKRANLYRKGGKEALQNKNGRPSYAEKAMEMGIYNLVGDAIYSYTTEYGTKSTFAGLAVVLNQKFPNLFGSSLVKYPTNLSRIINSEKAWALAYYYANVSLESMAELELKRRLSKGSMEDSDVIRAVGLAYKKKEIEIKVQQLEAELHPVENTESDIEFVFDDDDEQVVAEDETSQPE